MKRKPFPKFNVIYAKFLALNVISVILTQVLLNIFNTQAILVLTAIPIIFCGWMFGKRFAWYSALLLLTCNGVYFDIKSMGEFSDPQGLIFGVISYSLFASMGFALRFVRDLYNRIHQLNEEIKIKNLELQDAAFKDPLTDLHNRRYVKDVLMDQVSTFLKQLTTPEYAMRKLDIENKVLFLMIADIDNFKIVNDSYGHVMGDEVLAQVSKRIRESVRFDDTVVRWGGEEFLIICPMMNRDAAERVIQKVLDGVRGTPVSLPDGTKFQITISIGAIWIPAIRQSPRLLSFDKSIMIADKALYEVKTTGRNHGRLVVFRENETILHENVNQEFFDKIYNNPDYCEIRVVGMQ